MAKSCGATQPGADRFSYPLLDGLRRDIARLADRGARHQETTTSSESCGVEYHSIAPLEAS